MTEKAIKLVNEDGVIKGKDPETGEDVPIEFEDLNSASHATDETATDELKSKSGTGIRPSVTVSDDLELPVDHEGRGQDSSRITWDTPPSWEYRSGEFHPLLQTSTDQAYGISSHWQIMSAHHYGPAFNIPGHHDIQCPIHIFGNEPDHAAAEFSISWGDHHTRRQRMWLSKSGGAMLEEPSPQSELSILTNYRNQDQVTHLALTPNYLREERQLSNRDEITRAHTPITPGSLRFRGAYWDGGLETVRMLQFEPSMDGDEHSFHVELQVENEDGELVETARIDDDELWTFAEIDVENRWNPPSVESSEDLPGPATAEEPDLMWVKEEQRWYTFTESDGWIRSPPDDPE